MSLSYLVDLYNNPSVIDEDCKSSFALDLGILFVWGFVFRTFAFSVLQYRVFRMGTK